ncbi:MAG TPA: ferritin-like domain-containing protein [Hyphomicrobiaceae bacterium]|nr:ferritin-like domain-containing protein [Hyphomicrobiaceae bacterium]
MAGRIAAAEMVEGAGVDVSMLLTLLVDSAAGELSTCKQLDLLRQAPSRPDGERARQRVDAAAADDRRHFDALVVRIHELGGTLPDDMKEPHTRPSCPSAASCDTADRRESLLRAKQFAVRSYTRICDMTFGRDPRTYRLVLTILDEEIGHEAWLSELVGHNPGDRQVIGSTMTTA